MYNGIYITLSATTLSACETTAFTTGQTPTKGPIGSRSTHQTNIAGHPVQSPARKKNIPERANLEFFPQSYQRPIPLDFNRTFGQSLTLLFLAY